MIKSDCDIVGYEDSLKNMYWKFRKNAMNHTWMIAR